MFSEDERKKRIADSARRLIVEKKWKRLTVTDIVRECALPARPSIIILTEYRN